MESAGAMDVSYLIGGDGPRFIAIRGISDFADERKSQIEDSYRGAFRKLAIVNAATFLWAALKNDLFSTDLVDTKQPLPQIRIKEDFFVFLNSTDMIFQHRHKSNIYLSDLFVYPDMITIRGDEASQKLNSSILSDLSRLPPLTLILGDSQTGKTSLAKALYRAYFNQGALPLLLSGEELRKTNFSQITERAFHRQYEGIGSNSVLKDVRTSILIIDDYQKITINKKNQHDLLQQISGCFGHVIIIGNIDVISTDTKFADFSNFKCFELLNFGHVRRYELISKWLRLGQEDTISDIEFVRNLDVTEQHINSILLKNIVPSKPFYICSIMQYFEAATPSDYHLNSYGHCYQSLIVQAFVKAGAAVRDIDKYVNYLTELAVFVYFTRKETLSAEQFSQFSESYTKKYLIESHTDVIDMLIKCGLIRRDGEGSISFGYKYTYYFYCGKYLSDNFNRTDVQQLVGRLCESIWLEENANIIIFMTHHSKDQRLIDEIVLSAMMRFSDTSESTLGPRAIFLSMRK